MVHDNSNREDLWCDKPCLFYGHAFHQSMLQMYIEDAEVCINTITVDVVFAIFTRSLFAHVMNHTIIIATYIIMSSPVTE